MHQGSIIKGQVYRIRDRGAVGERVVKIHSFHHDFVKFNVLEGSFAGPKNFVSIPIDEFRCQVQEQLRGTRHNGS